MTRVFLDTSVLIRYLVEDDPSRALAAAELIDSEMAIVVSTGVVLESIHVLRTQYGARNPELGRTLISLFSKNNVTLADADVGAVVAAIGGPWHRPSGDYPTRSLPRPLSRPDVIGSRRSTRHSHRPQLRRG